MSTTPGGRAEARAAVKTNLEELIDGLVEEAAGIARAQREVVQRSERQRAILDSLTAEAGRLLLDAVLAHAEAVRAHEAAVLAIVARPLTAATTAQAAYIAYVEGDGKSNEQERKDRRAAWLTVALRTEQDAVEAAKAALERAQAGFDNAHLWRRVWEHTAELLAGGGK